MPPSSPSQLLLFDLDAVLINSAGYYRSLIETVRQVALALGFGDRSLTQEDIDAFEALDITAEWDSSALTAALLLVEAWKAEPAARLPQRPPLTPRASVDHTWPDVQGFLAQVPRRSGADPVRLAQQALLERLDGLGPEQRATIQGLLRDSRTLEASLTFWLVQLFNLGSLRFAQAYGLDPRLEAPSMLETLDRPTLSREQRRSLLSWLDSGNRGAAIVTNRPATSPGGIFNTPEAEIGARVSGLDVLPMVAAGDLGHRAVDLGLDPQTFLKPSPVHHLAGILLAAGQPREPSLRAAIRLGHFGEGAPVWNDLGSLHVWLFEDAAKGLLGLQSAAERLRGIGIPIELSLNGIAPGPPKSTALARLGARVFPSVPAALEEVYHAT